MARTTNLGGLKRLEVESSDCLGPELTALVGSSTLPPGLELCVHDFWRNPRVGETAEVTFARFAAEWRERTRSPTAFGEEVACAIDRDEEGFTRSWCPGLASVVGDEELCYEGAPRFFRRADTVLPEGVGLALRIETFRLDTLDRVLGHPDTLDSVLGESGGLARLRALAFGRSVQIEGWLTDLATRGEMPRLRALNMNVREGAGALFDAWAATDALDGLDDLELTLDDEATLYLPEWLNRESSIRLRRLHIESSSFNDADLIALLEGAALSELEELVLEGAQVTALGIEALARHACASRLESLRLPSNRTLSGRAARAVWEGGRFPSLSTLDIGHADLGSEDVEALARGGGLPSLRHLRATMRIDGFLMLFDDDATRRLKTLDLYETGSNWWSFETKHDVGAFRWFRGLERLTTSSAEMLGDPRVSPWLDGLKAVRLSLRGSWLRDEGFERVCDCLGSSRVTELDVYKNDLMDRSLAELARCEAFEHLEVLNLSKNLCSDEGLMELARSPLLTSLRWLGLGDNAYGTAGALALSNSPYLKNLRHIDLGASGRNDHMNILRRSPVFGEQVTITRSREPGTRRGLAHIFDADP